MTVQYDYFFEFVYCIGKQIQGGSSAGNPEKITWQDMQTFFSVYLKFEFSLWLQLLMQFFDRLHISDDEDIWQHHCKESKPSPNNLFFAKSNPRFELCIGIERKRH